MAAFAAAATCLAFGPSGASASSITQSQAARQEAKATTLAAQPNVNVPIRAASKGNNGEVEQSNRASSNASNSSRQSQSASGVVPHR